MMEDPLRKASYDFGYFIASGVSDIFQLKPTPAAGVVLLCIVGIAALFIYDSRYRKPKPAQALQQKAPVKYCSGCGAPADESAKFCKKCGKELL